MLVLKKTDTVYGIFCNVVLLIAKVQCTLFMGHMRNFPELYV